MMRRAAAGELAEVLGPPLIDTDKRFRLHGFRYVARQVIEDLPPADRAILAAYVNGVNSGLGGLDSRPWEYLVLGSKPQAWRLEDSVLVAFSMYLNLNDSTGEDDLAHAYLRETLPDELFAFLLPLGTEWDAPISAACGEGRRFRPPMCSTCAASRRTWTARSRRGPMLEIEPEEIVGSNSWAVAATRLGRSRRAARERHAFGIAPAEHLVSRATRRRRRLGSARSRRRDVAGIADAHRWQQSSCRVGLHEQLRRLDRSGDRRDGPAASVELFERRRHAADRHAARRVEVRRRRFRDDRRANDALGADREARRAEPSARARMDGASQERHEFAHVGFRDRTQRERAARCREYGRRSRPERARGRQCWLDRLVIDGARADSRELRPGACHRRGEPRAAVGSVGASRREYPRIVDPPNGRLWTANTRTIEAQAWLDFLGDGGYDLGARAAQIRDSLFALSETDGRGSGAAPARRSRAVLDALARSAARVARSDSDRDLAGAREARELVEEWSARASVEDVGYRIVREFRLHVRKAVFDSFTAAARKKHPDDSLRAIAAVRGAAVAARDRATAAAARSSLSELERSIARGVRCRRSADMHEDCESLGDCTWGRQNTLQMRHPLSSALPFTAKWLDMPHDSCLEMQRCHACRRTQFGASQRLVVAGPRSRRRISNIRRSCRSSVVAVLSCRP